MNKKEIQKITFTKGRVNSVIIHLYSHNGNKINIPLKWVYNSKKCQFFLTPSKNINLFWDTFGENKIFFSSVYKFAKQKNIKGSHVFFNKSISSSISDRELRDAEKNECYHALRGGC